MATKYWFGGTATWNNTNDANWSLNSGNSPASPTTHPVAGDDVIFDANSGTGTVTRGAVGVTCSSINFTGYTGTISWGTSNTTVDTGNVTLSSGMTNTTSSGDLVFTGSGTQILTTAGKTMQGITLNGTGTLQLADNCTTAATNGAFTHTKGTLNLNGKTLTLGTQAAYSGSNSNTRAITWTGGGYIKLQGGNFTLTTTTNMTFTNPSQGTIEFQGFTMSVGSGLTLPPVVLTQPNLTANYTITSSSTLTSLTNVDGANQTVHVNITLGADLTVSGAIRMVGRTTQPSAYSTIKSDVGGTPRTISHGGFDVTEYAPTDITLSPAGVFRDLPADDAGTGNTSCLFMSTANRHALMGVGV